MNKENSKLLEDLTNMNKSQNQAKTRAQLLRQKLMNAKLNLSGEGGDEQIENALKELNKLMEEQENITNALEIAEKQGNTSKQVSNVLFESNHEVSELLKSLKESQDLNQVLHNKYDELAKQLLSLKLKMPLYLQPGSTSVPPPTGTVTLVFTDVKGSTVQWEKDPETMAKAITIHNKIMRKKLDEYKGYEVKTEGDAFMIAFGDCLNAVKWCLDLQQTLMKEDWPEQLLKNKKRMIYRGLREESSIEYDSKKRMIFRGLKVRMGINKGEPSAEPDPVTGRMDYFGQMVNQSARVEGIADGGQILISGTVWEDVEPKLKELGDPIHKDLGTHRLKGLNRDTHILQLMPKELEERKFPEIGKQEEEKKETLMDQIKKTENKNRDLKEDLLRIKMKSLRQTKMIKELKKQLNEAISRGDTESVVKNTRLQIEDLRDAHTKLQDKLEILLQNNSLDDLIKGSNKGSNSGNNNVGFSKEMLEDFKKMMNSLQSAIAENGRLDEETLKLKSQVKDYDSQFQILRQKFANAKSESKVENDVQKLTEMKDSLSNKFSEKNESVEKLKLDLEKLETELRKLSEGGENAITTLAIHEVSILLTENQNHRKSYFELKKMIDNLSYVFSMITTQKKETPKQRSQTITVSPEQVQKSSEDINKISPRSELSEKTRKELEKIELEKKKLELKEIKKKEKEKKEQEKKEREEMEREKKISGMLIKKKDLLQSEEKKCGKCTRVYTVNWTCPGCELQYKKQSKK
eukprot:TRINITY_DN964_c0_g1_i7.p1 TRINITY_DN964_c0_g1~~TRINITY_DN964_c0_g1_i7.p1  ORF type:complete len:876 (-),score=434.77 TRINITY_DN964_c0_g1_i7:46-2292(-)